MRVSSVNQRVIDIAEAELGVEEVPVGSNSGPRVRMYQASTSLSGTGWPWCAAFVEWVWTQARVPQDACSPSTAIMVALARRLGWLGEPTPGAAIVWPGTHTEILVAPAGDGLWHTIGGNTGNAVRRRVRSLQGAVVIVPPELAGGGLPSRLLYLEDLRAKPRLYGPWRSRRNRERVIAGLPPDRRERARRVREGRFRYGFYLGPRRVYGPWQTVEARDNAQAVLEKRLGHRLRRFSRPAPLNAGAAEALGNTV